MSRRLLLLGLSTLLLTTSMPTLAQTSIGVLMMHGKNPGNPQDPNFNALKSRLEREGMTVLMRDMPWSRTRYLDGSWDQAMTEISAPSRRCVSAARARSSSSATAWAALQR